MPWRCRAEWHGATGTLLPSARIEFRIGINLGDVIVEKGDVFGDGVNIAARLEQIAPPGGICLSEDAYRQVRGKLEIPIADAGEQNLKNISNPIKVYRIEPSVAAALEPEAPLARAETTIVGVGMGGGGDNGRDRFGGDHMVQCCLARHTTYRRVPSRQSRSPSARSRSLPCCPLPIKPATKAKNISPTV